MKRCGEEEPMLQNANFPLRPREHANPSEPADEGRTHIGHFSKTAAEHFDGDKRRVMKIT